MRVKPKKPPSTSRKGGTAKEFIARRGFRGILAVVGSIAFIHQMKPATILLSRLQARQLPIKVVQKAVVPLNRTYPPSATNHHATTTSLTELREEKKQPTNFDLQLESKKRALEKRRHEKYMGKFKRDKHHPRDREHKRRRHSNRNTTRLTYHTTNNTHARLMAQGIMEMVANHTSQHCLTPDCIESIAHPLARAFPDRHNKSEWCVSPQQRRTYDWIHRPQGLILVKVPKAASTTSAGVVLRLAHRHDCNLDYVHWQHERASKRYHARDPTQSFLVMSVRDPGKQIVSNVFWTFVTLRRIDLQEVTDEFLVRRVLKFGTNMGMVKHFQGGLQTQFASLTEIPKFSAWSEEANDLINPVLTVGHVQEILQGYDFVLVVERMDESLVAMALVLGVPVRDVVVTPSKVTAPGSQIKQLDYVYSIKADACLPVRSSFFPPMLTRYLASDYFRSQSYGDLILHAAANKSLDLTIERLGVQRFQEALKEYQYWKQKVKEECAHKVEFPCSSDAQPQLLKASKNCYNGDIGCGYQCVDDVLAQGTYSP